MSGVDLIVDLPFPDPHVEVDLCELSPSAYLQHPDTLSLVCEMTWLTIGPETQMGFCLEPPAIQDDRTILDYVNRVHQSVFKEEISIRIPGEGFVLSWNNGEVNLIRF